MHCKVINICIYLIGLFIYYAIKTELISKKTINLSKIILNSVTKKKTLFNKSLQVRIYEKNCLKNFNLQNT